MSDRSSVCDHRDLADIEISIQLDSERSCNMPRKYTKKRTKKYTDVQLKRALEAVGGGISIRKASSAFHVPFTTLRSHAGDHILYNRVGRPTKFTEEEELNLEQAAVALQVSAQSLSQQVFYSRISGVGNAAVD